MLSAVRLRSSRALRSAQLVRPAAAAARAACGRPQLSPTFSGALPSLSRSLATETSLSPGAQRVPADSLFAPLDSFTRRHVGPQPASVNKMLATLGFESLDAFIAECVPPSIRISSDVVSEIGRAHV